MLFEQESWSGQTKRTASMHNAANTQTKKKPPTPQIQHPKRADQTRSKPSIHYASGNDAKGRCLVPQPGSSLFLLLLPALVLELFQLFLTESLCASLGA